MTTDDRFIVFSVLLDGEPVDSDALAEALEDEEGRALLVDFARLRTLTTDDLDDASPGLARTRPRSAARWLGRVAVFALPVLLTLGGTLLYERWERNQAPTPDRVIEFTAGVDWNAGG
jgi:hypothetical protein